MGGRRTVGQKSEFGNHGTDKFLWSLDGCPVEMRPS